MRRWQRYGNAAELFFPQLCWLSKQLFRMLLKIMTVTSMTLMWRQCRLDPYSRQPEMLPCCSSLGEAGWSEPPSVHQLTVPGQCEGYETVILCCKQPLLCKAPRDIAGALSPLAMPPPNPPVRLLLLHPTSTELRAEHAGRGLSPKLPCACAFTSIPGLLPLPLYSPPFVLTTGPPPPCIMGAYADSSPPRASH